MENNDNQKVPMRIHQATATDNQANNAKDDYASTITNVSINSAGNADETILHIQTSEEEVAKGGSYDFADADDLGVPQQTELGSECNLLNSTSRKLHEVEFDYDKLE